MIFNLFSVASYTSILRIMTLPPVNNAFYHNFSTQHMSGTFFVRTLLHDVYAQQP